MKDMEEHGPCTSLGYIGTKRDSQRVVLDLSPLRKYAGKDLIGLTTESFLFDNSSDDAIEHMLSELSEAEFFISNEQPNLKQRHDTFRIFKLGPEIYQYYHIRSYSGHQISNPAIKKNLNKIIFEGKQTKVIPRDNILYSQMASWIRSNYGSHCIVPCSKKQLCCIWKLKFINAVRKTYFVVGGKYYQTQQFQYVQKLYAQCIDDIIAADSCSELTTIQNSLCNENLLILPLDTSWICMQAFCKSTSLKLNKIINDFSKNPSPQNFFELLSNIYSFHVKFLTNSKQPYIAHLSSEAVLKGLQTLYKQVCCLVQIFCDDKQIQASSAKVPCVTASQSLLQKVSPLPNISC